MSTAPAVLRCSVRGCGEVLREEARRAVCSKGHSFDRARCGYLNLLQPHDVHSKQPGDLAEVVDARRRWYGTGHAEPLLSALVGRLSELGIGARSRVLDVGSGEGSVLGRLQAELACDAWGIDLTVRAVELAAKRHSVAHFVVANADRELPFVDGAFDLVLSVNARRNAREFERVLAPNGMLLIVLPAEDDQHELRELLQGAGPAIERVSALRAELEPRFVLRDRRTLRWQLELDPSALQDLALCGYRGLRHAQAESLAQRPSLSVTLAQELLVFTRA